MCRKDQHLLSSVNCWYLVLNQTRRESRDHATLNDIYTNNVIVRLAQISEDVIRLFKKVEYTLMLRTHTIVSA
ncbi:SLIT-ROBO Rho GTPase-activating protein 3 isoform X1 [Tachysurus ichikawai]